LVFILNVLALMFGVSLWLAFGSRNGHFHGLLGLMRIAQHLPRQWWRLRFPRIHRWCTYYHYDPQHHARTAPGLQQHPPRRTPCQHNNNNNNNNAPQLFVQPKSCLLGLMRTAQHLPRPWWRLRFPRIHRWCTYYHYAPQHHARTAPALQQHPPRRTLGQHNNNAPQLFVQPKSCLLGLM